LKISICFYLFILNFTESEVKQKTRKCEVFAHRIVDTAHNIKNTKAMETKKNFVLDTNVILHDYKCIYNFEENDIYIPIVVLEEIDKFKKGSEQINFNSREFARELDEIATDDLFAKGVSLGEGKGRLRVVTNPDYPEILEKSFAEKIPDHRILAVALNLRDSDKVHKTILVTKDINLRMKAKSVGVLCEDYKNDKVTNTDIFEQAQQTIAVPSELNDRICGGEEIPIDSISELKDKVVANEFFILQSEKSPVLAKYDGASGKVKMVNKDKEKAFGIKGRNAEQAFALDALLNKNIQLVALTGKAGTGKTLLALAAALQQHENYKQILLARPIVALANKDLGFLPGDEKAKISPYMQPLFDNLDVIKRQLGTRDQDAIAEMQQSGQLVIEALAFIRGRSLNDTYFIVDEAQNLTPHEIKTIITRAGQNCKLVFTGDVQQIDTPYLDMQSNGLVYMIDKMRGQALFSHVNLVKGERSELSELASNIL
jgi:PhoH-like ATPase